MNFLGRDFLATIRTASTYDVLRPHLEGADPSDPLAGYSALDTHHYLADDILTKVDRMSMAHSLELRSPFLDYRVVELAATLPHTWKLGGGDTKLILKQTFADDLPQDVLMPRKRGFSVPMRDWLRHELRGELQEAIYDAEVTESGIFAMKEVRALAAEHLSGRRDRASQLWRYLFFVRWWHKHHTRIAHSRMNRPATLQSK